VTHIEKTKIRFFPECLYATFQGIKFLDTAIQFLPQWFIWDNNYIIHVKKRKAIKICTRICKYLLFTSHNVLFTSEEANDRSLNIPLLILLWIKSTGTVWNITQPPLLLFSLLHSFQNFNTYITFLAPASKWRPTRHKRPKTLNKNCTIFVTDRLIGNGISRKLLVTFFYRISR
jgi:hypothetical protein